MGAVDTTYTFTATDTITSAKMNNIIDQTTITTDAIIGTTLDVASGKLKIRSSGITSNEMGASSVTTNAITDGAVTSTKTDSNGPKWGGNYTDIGYASSSSTYYLSITPSRTSDGSTHLQFGTQTGVNSNATIVRSSGANGNLTFTNNGTAPIVLSASGGVTFGAANMPTPSGSAPIYGVRAWVNFDGTRDSSGATNASNTNRFIRSSGNVTNVKKDSTGRYTITFTTPFPTGNTNYTVVCSAGNANTPRVSSADRATATESSVQIETDDTASAAETCTENSVMVIG